MLYKSCFPAHVCRVDDGTAQWSGTPVLVSAIFAWWPHRRSAARPRYAAVTSRRVACDDEMANDVRGRLVLTGSTARGGQCDLPTANIRRTTSGLFRDFSRQFLHFGAVPFSCRDRRPSDRS